MQNRFENCAEIQPVLKCLSDEDSFEGTDPFGAFLMAVVEIMIETDMEVPNGNGKTD